MSDYNCIIGIDPGANGGVAVYTDNHISVVRMPKDLNDLRRLLEYYRENYNPIVFVEKINVRPDDIRLPDGSPNMGKIFRIQALIRNHEGLKAMIGVTNIPYALVHPLTWQSRLNLRKAGEQKNERKRRYKDVATSMFPSAKVTMWNCDALLIMQFGRWAVAEFRWLKKNIVNLPNATLFNNN